MERRKKVSRERETEQMAKLHAFDRGRAIKSEINAIVRRPIFSFVFLRLELIQRLEIVLVANTEKSSSCDDREGISHRPF